MAGNNIHSQLTDSNEIHVPKGFTEAANHTGLVKNTSGQLEWRDLDSYAERSNFTAIVDPTVNDDSTQSYQLGSRWINTVQKNMFECVDASVGAAVWRPIIKANPSGPLPPTVTDDASKGYKEGSIWIVPQAGLNQVWVCADSTIGAAEWQNVVTGTVTGLDHRTLGHLDSDDHLQYLNRSGVRPMTGNLDMGNHALDNVLEVNGVHIPEANVVRVNLNPGSGEFSSVAAAVASITTASALNPFAVRVGPGVFIESQIVMKPYVEITGIDKNSSRITPSNPNQDLIIACDNSSLHNLTISGVTGARAVYLNLGVFEINLCNFVNNSISLYADGSGVSEAYIRANGCVFSNILMNAAVAQSGTAEANMIIKNALVDNSTPSGATFLVSGSLAELIISATVCEDGLSGSTCIEVRDGAFFQSSALVINEYSKGLYVPNTGAAPSISLVGTTFLQNTIDIQIDHPGTSGTISATFHEETSIINPATIGSIAFIALDTDGNVIISNELKQLQPDNTATDMTTLISKSAMGLLTDGDISPPVSGFTVTVEAGFGYVHTAGGSLKKFIWPNTPVTVAANSSVWIYFDSTGAIQQNVTLPDVTENIVVGRVVTNSTGIMIIEESGFQAEHSGNRIGSALRDGLGAVFVSGSNVAEVGTRTLNVTPGSYYYGERNFLSNGGNPVTFTLFYQNGTGGWTITPGVTTIDNANYDNGTGTLASIGAGNYAKHSLYLLGDATGDFDSEAYFVVYSQAQYTSLTLAEQGPLPNPPNYLSGGVTLIASIIVQQGVSSISEIRDERPITASKRVSTVAATTFHSGLLGLTTGDDHPQYWRNDGTHVATGDFNLGTHNITNLGTANGVTIEAHASRHQPGGADAIPTAAASSQTPDQSNAVGSSTSLARADHVHNIPTASAVGLDSTSTNTQGSNASFARSNHTHAITSGTPVTQNTDQANAIGSAVGFAKADHVHNIPTAIAIGMNSNTANSQGTSTSFSRADHQHAIAVAAASTQTPNQTNAAGTANGFARADHVHNIPTAAPANQTIAASASDGSATTFARADHLHTFSTAAASSISTSSTNTQGSSTSFARADHTHAVTIINQQVSAAAGATTVALTDTLVPSMTITPAAGVYKVSFISSNVNSGNGAQRTFTSVYFNGTQVTNSEVAQGYAGGAYAALAVQAIVTADGVNPIEIRARVAGGTTTWYQMVMAIQKLSN